MTPIDEHTYNNKLEDALQMLAAGMSVDEILAHANSDAAWLAPMLETAAEVTDLQQSIPIPPPDASLQRLLAYGEELATASQPVASQPPPRRQSMFSGWWARFFMGTAAVMLLILILLGGVNSVAQDSLPGQSLFFIKKTGETLQLNFPWNFERREQLLERFNKRRQNEVKLLLEQGQQANVTFSGSVESLAGKTLMIDGFTIEITPETETTGEVAAGARVRLNGLTQPPNGLVALTIIVIEPSLPALVTPLPTDTPSPTPTHTSTQVFSPTPTETLSPPTFTPTSIIVEKLTVTDTPTVSPTPSYTPLPTVTPVMSSTKPASADESVDDDTGIVDEDNTDNASFDNDDGDNITDDAENLSNNEDDLDNHDDDLDDDNNEDDFDTNSHNDSDDYDDDQNENSDGDDDLDDDNINNNNDDEDNDNS